MQSEINKKINPHVEGSGSLFPVPSAPGPLAQQLLRTAEARSKLPPTCHCAGKELRVRVKNGFNPLHSSDEQVGTTFQAKQQKPWTPSFFISSFHRRLFNATMKCCARICHFEFFLTHNLETSIESPTLGKCIALPVMEVRHDSLKVPSSARSTRSSAFELIVNDIRLGSNQL